MAFFNRPHPNALPARTPDRPHGLQIEPIWFEWLALGGLQLTRPDRFADAFVADCQRAGLSISRGA